MLLSQTNRCTAIPLKPCYSKTARCDETEKEEAASEREGDEHTIIPAMINVVTKRSLTQPSIKLIFQFAATLRLRLLRVGNALRGDVETFTIIVTHNRCTGVHARVVFGWRCLIMGTATGVRDAGEYNVL